MSLFSFLVWLVIAIVIAVAPSWASFVYLDELGAYAPRLGYNATNLQNVIIIASVSLAAVILACALWMRLRPINVLFRIIFVLALFAGVAIALLNGPLFWRPVLPIPQDLAHNLVLGCVVTSAVAIALAIVQPEHQRGR